MKNFIHHDTAPTKKQEIVRFIELEVEAKKLRTGEQLPSLSAIRERFSASRDTAIDAYRMLKSRGLINAVAGKGYFLAHENIATKTRIFVLFDELNAFKETLYKAFIAHLGKHTEVDIFFHHFNKSTFESIITNSIGKYSHYVIMPANLSKVGGVLAALPENKVYILDQMHSDLKHYPAIYQNFSRGVFACLQQLAAKIKAYQRFTIVFNPNIQPQGILAACTRFCETHGMPIHIVTSEAEVTVAPNEVYFTLDDATLIAVIKQIKQQNLQLAKNVGIIAYNDSPLKEIIGDGITTISTDFEKMGKELATMITSGRRVTKENDIIIKSRYSL